MAMEKDKEAETSILDERTLLTLSELCRACEMPAEQVLELVEEGIIESRGGRTQLRFSGICVRRVRKVYTLRRDLGVNLEGAALAIELLEEIEQLRARLRRLEN